MHPLRPVVLAAFLATLAGCQSAAPAPCLIQRPGLGGYTMKLTLQGTPPSGCETILPPIFGDNGGWTATAMGHLREVGP